MSRRIPLWVVLLAIAIIIAGYVAWYETIREETAKEAYLRIRDAWIAREYGAVFDALTVEGQEQVGRGSVTLLHEAATKLTDPAEAERLRSLEGREAFIEAFTRQDQSLPQLEWEGITEIEEGEDRANLYVYRSPVGDLPTTGIVYMVKDNGVWKLAAVDFGELQVLD